MRRFIELTVLVVALAAPFLVLAQDKPILAVMGIEDKTGKFERKDLEAATEYLSTSLITSGSYSVVEKGRQEAKKKQVVKDLKRETYDTCYDDKCRIELGRALAADTLLACSIIGIGKSCTLTCRMVPLEKEVANVAGLAEFDCGVDALVGAVKATVKGIDRPKGSKEAEAVSAVSPTSNERVPIEWVYSKPAGLYFAKTETTVAQYQACVAAGGCGVEAHHSMTDNKSCNWGHSDRSTHSMNCVTWHGAHRFCEWAGGRLPTEDEWHAEASNGGSRVYPWGDWKPSCSVAVMDDGTDGCGMDRTWLACSKAAGNSVSGLCDMSGSVWEWTSSWFDRTEKRRVMRGGSWLDDDSDDLRASTRYEYHPDGWDIDFGFRCVRTAPAVSK